MTTFSFKNIILSYGDKINIITEDHFLIKSERITLIKGDNGTGKSTLLKGIAGKLDTSNNDIKSFIDKHPKIFYYHPEDHLFPEFSILDYFFINCHNCKYKFGKSYKEFHILLDKVVNNIETKTSKKYIKKYTYIKELSTGNRIFLKFLNLYFNHYDVLFLDEPMSHLDDSKKEKIKNLILKYVKIKKTYCLLTTHDALLIKELMNDQFVKEKGIGVDFYEIKEKKIHYIKSIN